MATLIQGKVYTDRSIRTQTATVNGPMPWKECQCGSACTGWVTAMTGEHADVEVLSLDEFLKKYGEPWDGNLTTQPG